jgi:hypothetical protein
MRGFIEITLHAVYQFCGKTPLHFSPAQSPGYTGAMFSMGGIGWTYAKFGCVSSAFFAATFFKLPAIHIRLLLGMIDVQAYLSVL